MNYVLDYLFNMKIPNSHFFQNIHVFLLNIKEMNR